MLCVCVRESESESERERERERERKKERKRSADQFAPYGIPLCCVFLRVAELRDTHQELRRSVEQLEARHLCPRDLSLRMQTLIQSYSDAPGL